MYRRMNYKTIYLISLGILLISLISCQNNRGTIRFTANGEDFIANGFVSKDGWNINFDRVLVNLSGITAYNPEDTKLKAELPGPYLVNLKDSPIVEVANLKDLPKGNYQSLKFNLTPLKEGEFKGYSIIMEGEAEKNGERLDFLIKLNEELTFDGREGYVGDRIKGLLKEDETEVEMTFHFDHIFGDIEADANDHINTGSPGFDFFMPLSGEGRLTAEQDELRGFENYSLLIGSIETLGHLGEGHCEVVR